MTRFETLTLSHQRFLAMSDYVHGFNEPLWPRVEHSHTTRKTELGQQFGNFNAAISRVALLHCKRRVRHASDVISTATRRRPPGVETEDEPSAAPRLLNISFAVKRG
jgi:hypothetical protein